MRKGNLADGPNIWRAKTILKSTGDPIHAAFSRTEEMAI